MVVLCVNDDGSRTPDLAAAVRRTFEWFDNHSGWAAPDAATVGEWTADGVCRCPDDCLIAPVAICEHGLVSWWTVQSSLDRPSEPRPLEPARVLPDPSRLHPAAPGYVAAVSAHHQAIEDGDPGYPDPATGLFVLTARSLWDLGRCCDNGCRHCPFLPR